MTIPWDEYESAVLLKYRGEFGPAFDVRGTEGGKTHKVVGRHSQAKRQLDVAVYLVGDDRPRFVVDAKRKLSRQASVETVDQFVGMLDDLGVSGGALVCPNGWTPSAKRRAEAGDIRAELLTVAEALAISCRQIARRTLPFDWAFEPQWAEALVRLRSGATPGVVANIIDVLPFEEWLSFAHYALRHHVEEGVRVLEDVAENHSDDGHRFQAVIALAEHNRLRRSILESTRDKEREADALEELASLKTLD